MENGYILFVMIGAGFLGRRSIVTGFLAGTFITIGLHLTFNTFQLQSFVISLCFGAFASLASSTLSNLFAPALKGGNHNTSPYYSPMPGRPGGGQRGGIVYTDEDEKNARLNERKIK